MGFDNVPENQTKRWYKEVMRDRGQVRRMEIVIIAAVTATIVSVICCKISAKVTFNIIDKYVADMIRMAKESIRNAYLNK